MCVLCGDALIRVHWTEKQRDTRTTISMLTGDDYQRVRMRDRIHVVGLANRVLCHYGLRLDDWNGSKYILSDRKGRSEIVQDMGGLWATAEKITTQPLDPLEPSLLEALST